MKQTIVYPKIRIDTKDTLEMQEAFPDDGKDGQHERQNGYKCLLVRSRNCFWGNKRWSVRNKE